MNTRTISDTLTEAQKSVAKTTIEVLEGALEGGAQGWLTGTVGSFLLSCPETKEIALLCTFGLAAGYGLDGFLNGRSWFKQFYPWENRYIVAKAADLYNKNLMNDAPGLFVDLTYKFILTGVSTTLFKLLSQSEVPLATVFGAITLGSMVTLPLKAAYSKAKCNFFENWANKIQSDQQLGVFEYARGNWLGR